jgi:uncharacterized metal-binding protein YceD (DUF177 family)
MSERERRDRRPQQPRSRQGRDLGRSNAASPWSFEIPLAEIPDTGRRVELRADQSTREAVAKLAGLVAVPRLEATFDLAPFSDSGVRVSGTVSATVEQSCVVTLEPVLNEINEAVDLILVESGAMPPPRATLDIDVAGESDLPDVLHDRAVDLGALATEFLILGIDPYPRKAGAQFQAPSEVQDPADHPFAALGVLKKDSGSKPQ